MSSRLRSYVAICLALSSVSACAAAGAEATTAPPAWFEARAQELNDEGYPDLARAPATSSANTDPAYWRAVEAELAAAEAAMRANPRSSQPTDAPEAASFEADAAAALAAARGPN